MSAWEVESEAPAKAPAATTWEVADEAPAPPEAGAGRGALHPPVIGEKQPDFLPIGSKAENATGLEYGKQLVLGTADALAEGSGNSVRGVGRFIQAPVAGALSTAANLRAGVLGSAAGAGDSDGTVPVDPNDPLPEYAALRARRVAANRASMDTLAGRAAAARTDATARADQAEQIRAAQRADPDAGPVATVGQAMEDAGKNAQEHWQIEKETDAPTMVREAKAANDAKGFAPTLKAYATNPMALADMLGQSAADNVIGLATGTITANLTRAAVEGIAVKAAKAAGTAAYQDSLLKLATEPGFGGGTAVARAARDKASDAAYTGIVNHWTEKAAGAAGNFVEGSQSGSSTGAQVADSITAQDPQGNYRLPADQLAAQNPRFVALLDEGMPEAAARSTLAAELYDQVSSEASAATRLSGHLTGAAMAEGKVAANGHMSLGQRGLGLAKETVNEAIQNTGENAAQFRGQQQVDPNAEFDAGGSAAQGAVGGLGQGAAMHAAGHLSAPGAVPVAGIPVTPAAPVTPPAAGAEHLALPSDKILQLADMPTTIMSPEQLAAIPRKPGVVAAQAAALLGQGDAVSRGTPSGVASVQQGSLADQAEALLKGNDADAQVRGNESADGLAVAPGPGVADASGSVDGAGAVRAPQGNDVPVADGAPAPGQQAARVEAAGGAEGSAPLTPGVAEQAARLPPAQAPALVKVYADAEREKPAFDSTVQSIADEAGATAKLVPLKAPEKAANKIIHDYGGDPTRIKDILRATINVRTIDEADAAIASIYQRFKVQPTGGRNLLRDGVEPMEGGYRDAKFNVDINGHIAEIQVNVPEMVEAKAKAHDLYNQHTALKQAAHGRLFTPEEQAESSRLIAGQEAHYLPAWERVLSSRASAVTPERSHSDSPGSALPAARAISQADTSLRNDDSDTGPPLREADSARKTRGGDTSQAAQENEQPGTLPTETGIPSTSSSLAVPNERGSVSTAPSLPDGAARRTPLHAVPPTLRQLFSKSLGFSRGDMPQIPNGAKKQKFIAERRAAGIGATEETVDARSLKPTQGEFNADNVDFLRDQLAAGKFKDDPIIVSKDGRILDGHHRWASLAQENGKVNVLRIDQPITALMKEARAFGERNGIDARGKSDQIGQGKAPATEKEQHEAPSTEEPTDREPEPKKTGTEAFTRAISRAGGADVARVQTLADQIAKGWKNAPKIKIIQSMDDAPAGVRQADQSQQAKGANGEPAGFFYNGTVYIVAGQMGTARDVAQALFHETLGHYGLRGAFGKSLDGVLRQMAVAREAAVRAKAKEYGLDYADPTQRMQAAEEVLAELAQTQPKNTYVQQAIAAIRTWLRENIAAFKDLALSDAEIIRSFIEPARDFVKAGARDQAAPLLTNVDTTTSAPKAFANDYAALAGKKIALPVRVADSGKVATITVDAAKEMRDLDAREDLFKNLIRCLK